MLKISKQNLIQKFNMNKKFKKNYQDLLQEEKNHQLHLKKQTIYPPHKLLQV